MFYKLVAQLLSHNIRCNLSNFPFGIGDMAQILRSSEFLFDKCKTELNWVELWAIWWKVD
jgi:hypothetical protein